MSKIFEERATDEVWKWSDSKIHNEIYDYLKLNLKAHIRFDPMGDFIFNRYHLSGRLLQKLYNSKGPLIIATDGAHENLSSKTSAAFCICTLDIRPGESILSENWTNRPMIPLCSRTKLLPKQLGTSQSDIATGECYAFIMKYLAIDNDLERITITDSNAIRDHIFTIRNRDSISTDREYIRSSAGGISKYLSGIIQSFEQNTANSLEITSSDWRWFRKVMALRKKHFLKIAESWVYKQAITDISSENQMPSEVWEEKYLDHRQFNSILKVNSHQLCKSGTQIKSNPRYKRLTPNLALLSGNHHADRAADLGITFRNFAKDSIVDVIPSNLTFSISWNGKTVDRHVGDTLWTKFAAERLKRLRTKATQGLLWRIRHLSSSSWEDINSKKSLLRLLLGLTNTHTRCIYKSDVTRNGYISDFLSTVKDPERKSSIENSSSTNKISYIINCKRCTNSNLLYFFAM